MNRVLRLARAARPVAMAADVILQTRDVAKHYGGLRAVDGVSLEFRRGSLTGIIGPNGAGKSTLFNLLAGSEPLTAGAVAFDGKDVTDLPAFRRARLGLARTFQLSRALARLTVRENLALAPGEQPGERVWAPLLAAPRVAAHERDVQKKVDETLAFFEIAHVADEYAGALSGGQKKLLELARALMRDPSVVLLDEPMAGVNPTLARKLMDKVEDLRRTRGITFVLVEHDLETVFTRCDPIIVMAQGKVLAHGDAATVRANRDVLEAYLGG
ncbi:MAG TPA: ABC transporter ATP-binding protein [Candidatus Thermoplasmatota archaeon]|nr:ABC transporter ATP-binding protein [Candidatus Thermoplasmatota archaeon]